MIFEQTQCPRNCNNIFDVADTTIKVDVVLKRMCINIWKYSRSRYHMLSRFVMFYVKVKAKVYAVGAI